MKSSTQSQIPFLTSVIFYLTLSILCQVTSCFALKSQYTPPNHHHTILRHDRSQLVPSSGKYPISIRGGTRSTPHSTTSLDAGTTSSNDNTDPTLSTRGGNAAEKTPPPQPTLRDLVNFALPCLGLWISGPLLSLVDTASVGLTAKPGQGALELGALGPATTFIDGATYLFAFLNVATTNLFASAMARHAGDEDKMKRAGDAVVRTAMKISIFCGFGIMTLLLTQGQSLLKLYIGEAASSKVLAPATTYVHIRALSMPTSLLSGVLQAALLGAKDSVTPLVAVLASTITNVLGDTLCVVGLRMGSKGAAIATLVAQWVGTIAMWRPARNKLLTMSTPEQRKENKVSSQSFLSFAAPVLTLILGKLAAFGVMTHVAAALPGEAALAGHQIVLSLFLFVSPFLEVISQTAQAFLPQYFVEKTKAYGDEAESLALRLLKLGMISGTAVALLVSSIPKFFPFILTNDSMVQNAVRPLALPLFLGSLLTAPVAVSEGILLARRELKYLASVYVLSTIMFPFGLFKLKSAGGPVCNVWYGFVFFQLFRALCFTGRLWGPTITRKILSMVGMEGKESTPESVAIH